MKSNEIKPKPTSSFERLYGRPLSDEEVAQTRSNLARFLKLLIRIDRRLKREDK